MKSVLEQGSLNEHEAFSNLIDALRVAESSAKQLAFVRGQKQWLSIEFQLGSVRELVMKLAVAKLRE